MSTTLSFDLESPAWLRSLRWLALFAMAATMMGAKLCGVSAAWVQVNTALALLSCWNFCLPILEDRFFQSTKKFVFFQLLVDILGLTTILWWSGGLVNPFASFYIFHVMIAGLLLNPKLTRVVSAFACSLVIVLTFAPGMIVRGKIVRLQESPIWFGIPVSMIILIVFTTIFILAFLSRLSRSQDDHRRRTKMEALGRLVGGLAHEVGTPLNSILVLAKDLAIALPPEHKRDAEIIHEQAKRCGDIVSLLLGYSRGIARMDELRCVKVNLAKWIEEIHRSLSSRDAANAANIIDFTVEAVGLPKDIALPELILRQVLLNLFKNAHDATEHVLHPSIHVRIYINETENELCFCIKDNGPGFTKETKERAFEAFFTTKKRGANVGLGLYISYYLLDQVGGRIVVEENNEPGAMITVSIPYASAKGACP